MRRAIARAQCAIVVTALALPLHLGCAQVIAGDSGRALNVTYSYTGELVADVAGGAKRGVVGLGLAGAEGSLRLWRIGPWPATLLGFALFVPHGGKPSDLVGNLQEVTSLEAPARLWLAELWLQKNWLRDGLSLLAGVYDVNTEFYRLQSAALLINSSFGFGPELGELEAVTPSTFPTTAVGTRLEADLSCCFVLRAAVLNGGPVQRESGGVHVFAAGDGAMLIGEAVLVRGATRRPLGQHQRFQWIGRGIERTYTGKLALGGWYFTRRFPSPFETDAAGEPVQHHGVGGAYLLGDGVVWRAPGRDTTALSAFLQLGLGSGRANQVDRYLGGGLTLAGPLESRSDDQVGVAVAAAINAETFERAARQAGEHPASEVVVEATWFIRIVSGVALQPDLQYVIHPGGTRTLRNALVLLLRLSASY